MILIFLLISALVVALYAMFFLFDSREKFKKQLAEVAIEKASLYERMSRFSNELESKVSQATADLKKKYNQLEIIHKITTDVNSDIELDKILGSIIKGVQMGLGFDRVGIFEVDEKNNSIKGRLGVDRIGRPENIENQAFVMDEEDNNFAKIALGKIAYFFTEDAESDLPESQKKYIVSGLKQNAIVPMKILGKIIGMIAVDNVITKKAISDEDIKLLLTFADQAAAALHKAKMYGKERETSVRLKKLEELKSVFLSKISHELRTPLASIKDSIALLLNRITGEITPQQEKFLNIATNNVERLSYLIEEFLEASKMEAKKIDLEISAMPPLKVIDEVVYDAGSQLEKKKIRIIKDIQLTGGIVHADNNKMYRVLLNLVGNAIKFTPEGGVITISAKDSAKDLEISVADSGMGIDKQYIGNIFEKYYQIENNQSKSQPGIGLGLTIAKEIVEAHGGKIFAESAGLGKGSKFTFTIPKG